MNIIKGINKIQSAAHYIFKYEDEWLTARRLVSRTQEVWKDVKDNRTKHSMLADQLRWKETGLHFQGDVAAKIPLSNCIITTNGTVIGNNGVIPSEEGKISIEVGGQEKQLKIADLLYHAFIDVYYNPTTAAAKGSTLEDLRLEGEEPLEPTPEPIDGLSPAAAEFKKRVETFVKENNMYEYYAGLHTPESNRHKHAIEKLYNGGTITDWEKYVD